MSDLLLRTEHRHKQITVTGYVVNPRGTKMLLVHHVKLGKRIPPGGHLEDDEIPHLGAIREVQEETGVTARVAQDQVEPNL
jgi:8-oxo-dGTP pyrophosphatase MutT (NUDIX family)